VKESLFLYCYGLLDGSGCWFSFDVLNPAGFLVNGENSAPEFHSMMMKRRKE
jgi:hypothetical protein